MSILALLDDSILSVSAGEFLAPEVGLDESTSFTHRNITESPVYKPDMSSRAVQMKQELGDITRKLHEVSNNHSFLVLYFFVFFSHFCSRLIIYIFNHLSNISIIYRSNH